MPKKGTGIYYPRTEGEILGYYNNIVTKIAALAAKYGISTATITKLQEHYSGMLASYHQAIADANAAQSSTEIKHQHFANGKADMLLLLKQMQLSPDFDENDAELLGIHVTSEPVDLRTVKPVIMGITVKYGMVIIEWLKKHMDGVIIYGSYDGKNFSEIGRDIRSPFEDVRPNRTDQPEERHYRLAYMKNDKPVGVPSEISKVIVDTSIV